MARIKILHLEDSESDALLIRRKLEDAELLFDLLWVDNKESFQSALLTYSPDIVISDHQLPSFSSTEALEMVKEEGGDTPFILVTATVSEVFAVTMLKNGAEDYILKDRLQRLPSAILSTLEKRKAERESRARYNELRQNEKKFRALIENTNDLIGLFDDQFKMIYRSPNYSRVTGWSAHELRQIGGLSLIHPEDFPACKLVMEQVLATPRHSFEVTYRFKCEDGHYIWLSGVVTNWLDDKSIAGIVSNMRDVTESRQAVASIREAHDRLVFHVENSPLGFIEWDNKLHIKSCSKRAQEIFGWSDEDVQTNAINDQTLVYKDDIELVDVIAKELLSGNVPRNNTQHRNVKKDGTVIWCEWFNSVLKDQSGQVVTIMSLVQDVTARRVSDELIRKSEANLTAIIENTDAFIYSVDTDLRYITFNSALKNILLAKYGVDVKPGMKALDFVNSEADTERLEWNEIYKSVLGGQSRQFIKNYSTSARASYVNFSFNPILENGKTIGISCFCRDITEQYLAQEKITQSEIRFRALIDNSYDAILVRDINFRIKYASPSASRILGLTEKGNTDDDFSQTVHPEDFPFVSEIQRQILKTPGKPFFLTFRKLHSGGHYVWVEGVMTNMLNRPGIEGIVSNFRDITERHNSEEEKSELVAQLIEKNNDLMQFSFIASHNLRGPVASLLGLINLFETIGDFEKLIPHVKKATKSLDSIIRDISEIITVRTTGGHLKESVNILDVITEIQRVLESEIVNYDVRFDLKDIEVTVFHTIKTYFHSILYNLISNSIKYRTQEHPLIVRIKTFNEGGFVNLVVQDNGSGIDLTKYGNKIFNLYQRFHQHVEGKGLGLYMVKTQVQAMNGTIEIESMPEQGTTFTTRFKI